MEKIQIIIDDREQAVIPYFNEYKTNPNITYCVQRINVGDYSIVYNDHILMSIERKSWKDLAASIKDGRKENVNKMLKLREDVGCQLFYLIEGTPLPKDNVKFGRIPYKNLRSHLDHLIMRDNIHVIHSKDQKNTVDRIFELVKNYLTITPSPLLAFNNTEVVEGGAITKLKEKIVVLDITIIYKIWGCVPNITEKTASLFINQNYHISNLILGNISKDQIYSLKYDTGYVIGSRSKKIWDGSRIKDINNKYFVKMLTQIRGITKKTAEIILDTVEFRKLLEGGITLDTLSKINKTPSVSKNTTIRAVGKKAASEILKFFVNPENLHISNNDTHKKI
jgi:ERCC4-type nuclease